MAESRNSPDLIYLAFNGKVAALRRDSGEIEWDWQTPKGRSSYVAMLLDFDRLIVSCQGYTFCLDAATGRQLWDNPMKGFGLGIPSLVCEQGISSEGGGAAAAQAAQQQAAASSAAH